MKTLLWQGPGFYSPHWGTSAQAWMWLKNDNAPAGVQLDSIEQAYKITKYVMNLETAP